MIVMRLLEHMRILKNYCFLNREITTDGPLPITTPQWTIRSGPYIMRATETEHLCSGRSDNNHRKCDTLFIFNSSPTVPCTLCLYLCHVTTVPVPHTFDPFTWGRKHQSDGLWLEQGTRSKAVSIRSIFSMFLVEYWFHKWISDLCAQGSINYSLWEQSSRIPVAISEL